MLWIQIIVTFYLVVSNLAIIIRLYKSFLQYLSPVKGYAMSLLLVITLLSVDYAVFKFTSNFNDVDTPTTEMIPSDITKK